jgi:hypothetical protein
MARIAECLADGPPLAYMFVHWGMMEMQKTLGERVPGMVTGLALGGGLGEMIFGGSMTSSGSGHYIASLGMLVVTDTKLHIGSIHAEFEHNGAAVHWEHLQQFKEALSGKHLTREDFLLAAIRLVEIPNTQRTIGIEWDNKQLVFFESDVYLNDTLVELANLSEIKRLVQKFGSLPSADQFLARLEAGESPVSPTQYGILKENAPYIADLVDKMIAHPRFHLLISNYGCMHPSMIEDLEARISDLLKSAEDGVSPMAAVLTTIMNVVVVSAGLLGGLYYFRYQITSEEIPDPWPIILLGALVFPLVSIGIAWAVHHTWRESRNRGRRVLEFSARLKARKRA